MHALTSLNIMLVGNHINNYLMLKDLRGCYKIVCWPFCCYFKQYYLFIRFLNTLFAEFDKRMHVSNRNVWMEAKKFKTNKRHCVRLYNKISLLILLETRLTRNRNPRLPPTQDIVNHKVYHLGLGHCWVCLFHTVYG